MEREQNREVNYYYYYSTGFNSPKMHSTWYIFTQIIMCFISSTKCNGRLKQEEKENVQEQQTAKTKKKE